MKPLGLAGAGVGRWPCRLGAPFTRQLSVEGQASCSAVFLAVPTPREQAAVAVSMTYMCKAGAGLTVASSDLQEKPEVQIFMWVFPIWKCGKLMKTFKENVLYFQENHRICGL